MDPCTFFAMLPLLVYNNNENYVWHKSLKKIHIFRRILIWMYYIAQVRQFQPLQETQEKSWKRITKESKTSLVKNSLKWLQKVRVF